MVVSCSKERVEPMTALSIIPSDMTKADNQKGMSSFLVSEGDLVQYIKFRSLERGHEMKALNIAPISEKSDEPVAYIINYESGWEIVSADKRATPRLAYSEDGVFSLEQCPDTQKAWLASVMNEINILRGLSEAQLSELDEASLDEMAQNTEFWDAVTASESYLQRLLGDGYRGDPQLGYYEMHGVIVDTLEYEVVNHLMAVHWHQSAPYNAYCPLRTDYPTLRAPSGCGAVAAAQILWYLHINYGFPEYAPTSATCIGNVDSYTMTQSGQSSTIWDTMFMNDDAVAILMAKVGTMVGMQYSNTNSISYFGDFAPYVFTPFGISCSSYSYFNASVAGSNLLNGLPIFVRAATANDEGHFFVIDGYKAYHVGHGIRYIWVSTDPSPDPQTIIDPIIDVYTYFEDPFVREFSMNWGWGPSYDNGWYTTTGSWTAGGYAFDYGKMMLANFAESN